ncbi:MAG: LysM peptidoglycan-binding domain-containing protein [Chloroflexi bacterium]|nr:MAG: LysM peptidoglycan-binding domain-containing protein [Chloroflexota bacterium]
MQWSVPPLLRRWQGAKVFTRHMIVLLPLVILLLGSILGGRLLGVFAQSPCARGDASYSVRFGDTLSAIAMRYRTTWQRLAPYNHIANANLIFPGQQVCIPGKGSTGGTGGTGGTGSTGGSHQHFVTLATQDALNVGLSPNVFVRQINQESSFNPSAVSSAGALGIAQFEPGTAASLGVNPWDPVQSLQGASRLMASYVRQFGGDIAKALAAYNAGPGAVQRAVMLGGTNWRAFLPAETQNYIRVILG